MTMLVVKLKTHARFHPLANGRKRGERIERGETTKDGKHAEAKHT